MKTKALYTWLDRLARMDKAANPRQAATRRNMLRYATRLRIGGRIKAHKVA